MNSKVSTTAVISGNVKATLIDNRTQERRTVSCGSNMILGSFLNRFFEFGSPLLHVHEAADNYQILNNCSLGDGDTPTTINDTSLSGNQLAESSTQYSFIPAVFSPTSRPHGWAFNSTYDLICICSAGVRAPIMLRRLPDGRYTRIHFPSYSANTSFTSCAFTHDGNYLLLGGTFSNGIAKYKITEDNGEILFTLEPAILGMPSDTYQEPNGIVISPDDQFAFVVLSRGNVASIDLRVDGPNVELTTHSASSGYDGIVLAPDGSHVLIATSRSSSRAIARIDLLEDGTWGDKSNPFGTSSQYASLAFSPDGKWLVIAGSSSGLNRIYRYENGAYTLVRNNLTVPETGSLSWYDTVFVSDSIFYTRSTTMIACWEISEEGELQFIEKLEYSGLYLTGYNPKHQELFLTGIAELDVCKLPTVNGVLDSGIPFENALEPKLFTSCKWVFPAGEGTGTISEALVKTANANNISSRTHGLPVTPLARKVFETPIIKTEFHALEIEWTLSVSLPELGAGIISGGQVDGSTDISWCAEIPIAHLKEILTNSYGYQTGSSFYTYHYRNPVYRLIEQAESTSGSWGADIIVGDSNDLVDLEFFVQRVSVGAQLFKGKMVLEADPYVPNSFQRRFRIGLDVDIANGNIGEIVIQRIGRFTFDPPLQKSSDYRLYIDFVFALSQGEDS